MKFSRNDLEATGLTILVALTYAATHEGWSAPLIGDSHRWATVVILALGATTCGLGESQQMRRHWVAAALGVAALVFAVLALVTGSLTPLSLLVATIVALWGVSTAGHLRHPALPV